MSLQVHQLHRLPSSSCPLHPDELVTGFCASCLRDRLTDLDYAASGRKSASSSAFKSLFLQAVGGGQPTSSNSTSSSFSRPELRRCKSCSCGRGDGFSEPRASAAFELQRKSCDVRVRNTLCSLFHQDNSKTDKNRVRDPFLPSASSSSSSASAEAGGEVEVECRNLRFPPPSSSVAAPVLETREEEEEEEGRDSGNEIRVVDPVLVVGTSGEIEGGEREEAELKPMKDHMGFDSAAQAKKAPPKDLKDIAGSFWLAASVFSKKLQKWRRKRKLKKQQGGSKAAASAMPPWEKPPRASRRFRDTHSEIAIDALGRRSCDTDPRFSIDASRISFDDPRFSWDEPRASWDGYLIGGRSVFPHLPPMLSVVEGPPAPAVQRSDGQIPVEEDAVTPGGSTQTRDCSSDASSRRRRSFERSNSVRKVTVETNDTQPASNAKEPPAGGTEFFPFHPGSLLDRDLRDFSSNSLRDDRSESFESAFRDSSCRGSSTKKSRRWSKAWNIWGLIHRRGSSRGGADVVRRSFSESWPELRARGYGGKIPRCNSSVSSRCSFNGNGGFGSMTRSSVETDGHGKKRREEIVLERNRSARYSPSYFENGLRRFHPTPMRNSRSGKGKHISSHYLTRSMLGLH